MPAVCGSSLILTGLSEASFWIRDLVRTHTYIVGLGNLSMEVSSKTER